MPDDLSKDANTLLAVLYRDYLTKRKNGDSASDAKFCGGAKHIRDTYFDMETEEDVAEWFFELGRNGYLNNNPGDDTVLFALLTDKAIVSVEQRFKKGFKEVTDFIAKFIP